MKSMFDQLDIATLHAKNSIVRAATAESLATPSGRPTYKLFDKYEELAEGGVGTIITGYAYVTEDGKPSEGALGIYDDSFDQDYRELVDMVHSHNARIVLQLVYGGSKSKVDRDDPRWLAPAAEVPADRTSSVSAGDGMGCSDPGRLDPAEGPAGRAPNVSIVGPSAIENPKTHLVPTEATYEDLHHIAQAFGAATERAKAYGFDGVEVHAAHGYLLSQFLSRSFNMRADEYGGTLENRTRLAVECIRKARTAVNGDFPILVKVNSCDDYDDPAGVHGGLSEDESAQVCALLSEAGANAIDVSGDWHSFRGLDVTGEPFFAHFGARLARELDIPVIVTGGWRCVNAIEQHMAEDGIDAIAMSRPFICEPDLVNRWEAGDTKPSKCTSCNNCARHVGIPCVLKTK